MEMQLTDMPAMRVGGVRHTGPYDQIRGAFEELGRIAGSAGLFGRDGVTMLGVYHDNPDSAPQNELRSDAAVTLPDDMPAPDGLTELQLPAGRFLHVVHRGSYERLGETWRFALQAANEDGRRIRDASSYEIYKNAPGEVPEDELQTNIYVPIE